MSDRTYNTVDICIYDEDWSEPALIVAKMLLTKCPNQYGIYKMPWGFLKKTYNNHFTHEEIETGVEELINDGMIALYDDRKVVWIKNKWGRDGYSGISNNQLGALRHIKEHFPSVYADFQQEYDLVPTEVQKEVNRSRRRSQQKPPLSRDSSQHPDTDSDTDTNTKKKEKKDIYIPTDKSIKQVRSLFPKLKEPRISQQSKTLDDIKRLDNPPDDLLIALKWAITDDFWKNQFQSCLPLRHRSKNDNLKWQNIYNAYKQATKIKRFDI